MYKSIGITIFSLVVVCQPARGDNPIEKPVRVPFKLLKTQHMLVEIKVNGKGPYRLIFDTGAPVTLINNKLAKEAGVIPKDFRRPFFAPFGSIGQFKIKSLELGDVKAKEIPTIVMDHPTVELMSKFMGPIHGIVGFSFFGRYRMSIDYQRKEMTFVPSGFEPPNIMEDMMAAFLKGRGKSEQRVLRPAGVWGFEVKESDDENSGVIITNVLPKSPAAKAGLRKGDRLLVLDDRWTDSVEDCYAAASQVRPGAGARASVQRGEKKMTITIQVKAGL